MRSRILAQYEERIFSTIQSEPTHEDLCKCEVTFLNRTLVQYARKALVNLKQHMRTHTVIGINVFLGVFLLIFCSVSLIQTCGPPQQGQSGRPGRNGRMGRQGVRGPQGIPGEIGDKGSPGEEGNVGVKGVIGNDGLIGIRGQHMMGG
ncbi:hypothetical protein DINM_000185 [Dirofilaria immitis]|nr:hypothetical protein [Dirofilaria immitis]